MFLQAIDRVLILRARGHLLEDYLHVWVIPTFSLIVSELLTTLSPGIDLKELMQRRYWRLNKYIPLTKGAFSNTHNPGVKR